MGFFQGLDNFGDMSDGCAAIAGFVGRGFGMILLWGLVFGRVWRGLTFGARWGAGGFFCLEWHET